MACTAVSDEVYYLDWQHECYAFYPHYEEKHWFNGVPAGYYAIFLAPDLSFGSFGHPWESTLCIWGDKYIDFILCHPTTMLSTIKRRK